MLEHYSTEVIVSVAILQLRAESKMILVQTEKFIRIYSIAPRIGEAAVPGPIPNSESTNALEVFPLW